MLSTSSESCICNKVSNLPLFSARILLLQMDIYANLSYRRVVDPADAMGFSKFTSLFDKDPA